MNYKLFLILLLAFSKPAALLSGEYVADKRMSIRQATALVLAVTATSIAGTIHLTEKCFPSGILISKLSEIVVPEGLDKPDNRRPIRAWIEGHKNVTIGRECRPSRKCLDYIASGELPETDWPEGGYRIPACFAGIDYTHSCHPAGALHGEPVRVCYSQVCPQDPKTGVVQNGIFFAGVDAIGSNNPCHPGMDPAKAAAGKHIFHCDEKPSRRRYLRQNLSPSNSRNRTLPTSHQKSHR